MTTWIDYMRCQGGEFELYVWLERLATPLFAGDEVRSEVKRVGHTVLGVATQCCDPVKSGVSRLPDSR